MNDFDVARENRVLRVRDAGDPAGSVVLYFHSTPGSRLDLTFGEQLAVERGVRLVSFDRPGYGGSSPTAFGLKSVAEDAAAVADHIGVDRFATLGQSGGGPFALAAATVLDDRVTRVGIASGPGPFQHVPGALDQLDDTDRAALALLPGDPTGAADGFAAGFEPLVSLFRDSTPAEIVGAFGGMLSRHDSEVMRDERYSSTFATTMRESLSQGTQGGGWDNVAWVGPWDIDMAGVECPVFLWYADEDRFVPLAHGLWLRDHVKDPRFVQRAGEGHVGVYEHFGEILDALTAAQ
jgi:pimeloyl-ACP methyl ester carboxylesterase